VRDIRGLSLRIYTALIPMGDHPCLTPCTIHASKIGLVSMEAAVGIQARGVGLGPVESLNHACNNSISRQQLPLRGRRERIHR